MANEALEAINREIRRYWKTHPFASDNVRGISQWWLADRYAEAAVAKALLDLSDQGIAQRHGDEFVPCVPGVRERRARHAYSGGQASPFMHQVRVQSMRHRNRSYRRARLRALRQYP